VTRCFVLERTTGIEPAFSAWEADVLPLNYVRAATAGSPQVMRAEQSSPSRGAPWPDAYGAVERVSPHP
jgi:hypothetical protein